MKPYAKKHKIYNADFGSKLNKQHRKAKKIYRKKQKKAFRLFLKSTSEKTQPPQPALPIQTSGQS